VMVNLLIIVPTMYLANSALVLKILKTTRILLSILFSSKTSVSSGESIGIYCALIPLLGSTNRSLKLYIALSFSPWLEFVEISLIFKLESRIQYSLMLLNTYRICKFDRAW
jgi:hypothetical protein